ncbi:hypothetical protein LXL04_028425 [Taraxacum kok-saghyz]
MMREKRSLGAGRSRWNESQKKNGEGQWYAITKGETRRNEGHVKGGDGGWQFSEATSFFISNLPKNCEEAHLWKPMRELGTVVDIFIIKNRLDKHGCRFGFVRFNRVHHVPSLESDLNAIKIEGRTVFARVAEFARPAKDLDKTHKRQSHAHVQDKQSGQGSSIRKNVSYAEATFGRKTTDSYAMVKPKEKVEEHQQQTKIVEIIVERKTKQETPSIRMVGKVKNVHALNSIYNVFKGEGYGNSTIDYMGGLWILINLQSSDEKEKLMSNQELRAWFSTLKQWDSKFKVDDRIVWVKIEDFIIKD